MWGVFGNLGLHAPLDPVLPTTGAPKLPENPETLNPKP